MKNEYIIHPKHIQEWKLDEFKISNTSTKVNNQQGHGINVDGVGSPDSTLSSAIGTADTARLSTLGMPLKMGHLKRKQSSSNHPFSGASCSFQGG